MVSTRTQNRQRKIQLLRETLDDTLTLLLLEHKDRDGVNMAEFKQLSQQAKGMLKQAKCEF